ncbi:MAG: regulatory protein RecX [Proteobacteria bacterium]|nr:regulatory protein RecX [Pseudomonadota bacterium]
MSRHRIPHGEQTPVQRALGLLTRREHSRKELTRKLAVRGVEKSEATAAVDRLAHLGWQDDTRFAESLARSRASAGYGPLRIRAELAMHGLDAERITAALAACDTDWREAAQALVARRFTAVSLRDPAHRRKAIELLLRRGFEHADAFAAARVDGGDEIFEELGCDE